jgi:hypothetical protein
VCVCVCNCIFHFNLHLTSIHYPLILIILYIITRFDIVKTHLPAYPLAEKRPPYTYYTTPDSPCSPRQMACDGDSQCTIQTQTATRITTDTHTILGRIHSHLQQGCTTQHPTFIPSRFARSTGSSTKKKPNTNYTDKEQKDQGRDDTITM